MKGSTVTRFAAPVIALFCSSSNLQAEMTPLKIITSEVIKPEIVLVLDTSGSMAWRVDSSTTLGTDCQTSRLNTVDIRDDGYCSGGETSSNSPKDCNITDNSTAAPGAAAMCYRTSYPNEASRMVSMKRVLRNLLPAVRSAANFGLVTFRQTGYFQYYKARTDCKCDPCPGSPGQFCTQDICSTSTGCAAHGSGWTPYWTTSGTDRCRCRRNSSRRELTNANSCTKPGDDPFCSDTTSCGTSCTCAGGVTNLCDSGPSPCCSCPSGSTLRCTDPTKCGTCSCRRDSYVAEDCCTCPAGWSFSSRCDNTTRIGGRRGCWCRKGSGRRRRWMLPTCSCPPAPPAVSCPTFPATCPSSTGASAATGCGPAPEKAVTFFLSEMEMKVAGLWDTSAGKNDPRLTCDPATEACGWRDTSSTPPSWYGSKLTLLSSVPTGSGDPAAGVIDSSAKLKDSLYRCTTDSTIEYRWQWAVKGREHTTTVSGITCNTWQYIGSYYTYFQRELKSPDTRCNSPDCQHLEDYRGPQFKDADGQLWVYRRFDGNYTTQGIDGQSDGGMVVGISPRDLQGTQDEVVAQILQRMNAAGAGGLNADGGTPTGPAIKVAGDHFLARQEGTSPFVDDEKDLAAACRPRFVFALTDGEANSGSAPEDVAKSLYNGTDYSNWSKLPDPNATGTPVNPVRTVAIGLPGLSGGTPVTCTAALCPAASCPTAGYANPFWATAGSGACSSSNCVSGSATCPTNYGSSVRWSSGRCECRRNYCCITRWKEALSCVGAGQCKCQNAQGDQENAVCVKLDEIDRIADTGSDGIENGLLKNGQPARAYSSANESDLERNLRQAINEAVEGDYVSTSIGVASGAGGFRNIALVPSTRFPDWDGQLRAFNVASGTPLLLWDAGKKLKSNDPNAGWMGRKIFTGYPEVKAGVPLSIVDAAKADPSDPMADTAFKDIMTAIEKSSPGFAIPGDVADLNRWQSMFAWLAGKGRSWRLGPIFGSTPATVSAEPPKYSGLYGAASVKERQTMFYVTSHDGVLHGFRAEDGTEAMAYVPSNLLPKIFALWASNNNPHRQSEDPEQFQWILGSSPRVQDVPDCTSGTCSWATHLVLTMGAADNAFLVLDVTNPTMDCSSNPCVARAQPDFKVVAHSRYKLGSAISDKLGETWSTPAFFYTGTGTSQAAHLAFGSGYQPAPSPTDPDQGGYYFKFGPLMAGAVKYETYAAPVLAPRAGALVDYAVIADTVADVKSDTQEIIATYQADLLGRVVRFAGGGGAGTKLIDAGPQQPFYYAPAVYNYSGSPYVAAVSGSANELAEPEAATGTPIQTFLYVKKGAADILTLEVAKLCTDFPGIVPAEKCPSDRVRPVGSPLLVQNDNSGVKTMQVFSLFYEPPANDKPCDPGYSYLVRMKVDSDFAGTDTKNELMGVKKYVGRAGGMTLVGGGSGLVVSLSGQGKQEAKPERMDPTKALKGPTGTVGVTGARFEGVKEVR